MPPIPLILVGGFLGAGKTTLIGQLARRLGARGRRVGLITNDQAANLVDTQVLQSDAAAVEEVSGGCFCCRFDDLVGAMDRLIARDRPDVLVGEPVGSCTDLSATVAQPMKQLQSGKVRLAPLSALIDARQVGILDRLRDAAKTRGDGFSENVLYIYEKQLEEADLIVLNKIDQVGGDELARLEERLMRRFAPTPVLTLSAATGANVDAWIDYVLSNAAAGRTVVDVDYDRYAAGEAELGWLNAAATLQAAAAPDWPAFCRELLSQLQRRCAERSAEIAHLKLHLRAGRQTLTANLTRTHDSPAISGRFEGASREARLLLNARVQIDPAALRTIVETSVAHVCGEAVAVTWNELQSFAPGRPQPVHRFPAPA